MLTDKLISRVCWLLDSNHKQAACACRKWPLLQKQTTIAIHAIRCYRDIWLPNYGCAWLDFGACVPR